ncbi:S1 family peptidase [Streptomyces xiaopingdaonensis]|uniref:S1 family peptidase n=1 Tax=Streptomyces xiaopingdaonensis TaxID=1565415 RepID=UPI000376465E|nr:S1 family peptidase [Streptomyces xiaopingdaonensis]
MAAGSALAAACVLALTALPANAGQPAPDSAAGSPTAAELPAGMLDAMQRDLGLSKGQVTERLAAEAEAADVEEALAEQLGASFGGAWVSGADAKLTVATTDAAEVGAIEARGAVAKVVDHSLKDLKSLQKTLDSAGVERDAAVRSVDVRHNAVTVRTSDTAAAERTVTKAGVDPSAVRTVKSAEAPRTYYDLVGGDAYYINGTSRCSIGFSVSNGSQQGFVTAGHCGRPGASTTGYNQVAQGTFQGSTFPGRDYAWVATNSNWTATPYVNGGAVRVSGSQQASVGSTVCRSGSTTGWHCGAIQQHNTSVTYPEGTITGVTRTSVCAEPGDSGGSFISGSQAQGMTSGGSGNCSSGGTTYYQPVNPALSAYGLSLTTG